MNQASLSARAKVAQAISHEELKEKAKQKGIEATEFQKLLATMLNDGTILEAKSRHYSRVSPHTLTSLFFTNTKT